MSRFTVKQKLIGMVIILATMVAVLSVFFINRFGAMADVYRQIPEVRAPQQQVADAMVQRVTNIRLNMNEAYGVQRDLDNYKLYAQRVRDRFEEYHFLSHALINGNPNLGTRLKDMEGLSIPPCRKGGQVENLTQKAASLLVKFEEICNRILDAKQGQLELTNAIGWYDSSQDSKGGIKRMVESGRELDKYADQPEVKLLVNEMRRQEKNILERADKRYVDRLVNAYHQFSAVATGQVAVAGKQYFEAFEEIAEKILTEQHLKDEQKEAIRTDLRESQKVVAEALNNIKVRVNEQMTTYTQEAFAIENSSERIILIVSFVMVFSSVLFGWVISNGINRSLQNIIAGLGEGAEQVASAAGQVSSSSQSLAEGSSEQAASIEETSASLEEISSMTKQNSAHSEEADNLMKEAAGIVQNANDGMATLTASMKEIHSASEETAKIIKTIDEIAFQTNLLALNAAVEAARAGEAGAGFAVVADEVRNLAMRAADAAKNTAELIEGTVSKVGIGSQVVTKTNETFEEVADSVGKVADLVTEIAAASNEQTQGVDQVNTAVAEMDKVVQQNAATAEESAGAAEELSGQAEQLQAMVNELTIMVGGHKQGTAADRTPMANARISSREKAAGGKSKAVQVDAKQVIPFDDEKAFGEF